MPRIIFINRFFAPDHSATSQILADLAFHLASDHEVHVVTSNQFYDDPGRLLPEEETLQDVQVHRVAATKFGRTRLVGRFVDYLSLYRALSRRLNALIQPGDLLISKTDPPLLSVIAARVARRKGATLINWLQDLYPEVAVELGVIPKPLARPLYRWRDRSLCLARHNVVLGETMAARVEARGVSRDSIVIIPNWCDDQTIQPISREENVLRREWGFGDQFVIGYSGNLGRAHEYQTILEAADLLAGRLDILFLMIGGGHSFEKLKGDIRLRGLENKFVFKPYQPRAMLAQSLSAADVHWVSLQPRLEGLIVPSKIYGILAAGRPILAISAEDGQVARLVENFGCGFCVHPGNGKDLAQMIEILADDSAKTSALGEQARRCWKGNFTMAHAFTAWKRIIDTP